MIGLIPNRFRIDRQKFSRILFNLEKAVELQGDCFIKLVNENEARRLNQIFRKKDYVPDVLSFPMNLRLEKTTYLGDVAICVPRAREQAREYGKTLEEELLLLMIHGVLHLCGMDHEKDRGEMFKEQEKLFVTLKKYIQ